jgi:hypothetical protein
MAAAACLVAAPSAFANGSGRTVCVLRNRPAAIQPVPRSHHVRAVRPSEQAIFSARINPYYGYVPGRLSTWFPGWKVPVVYGTVNPRLHYVSPILPNGYVGGLRNLPSNVVQIPPTFGKPGFHRGGHMGGSGHSHGGHGHAGGGHGGGGGGGGSHGK